MGKSRQELNDLRIGDTVKTVFSGNEKFKVYDIRTVHSQRENTTILEYKLSAFNKEELKTSWLYREQIIPIENDNKITCRAEFRQGTSHYSKEFVGRTEDEITDLINEEVEKKNSHYLSSKNI